MSKEFLVDLAERVLATYVAAVLTFVLADSQGVVDLDFWKAALLAGVPAALSVLKAAVAKQFGNPDSASLVK